MILILWFVQMHGPGLVWECRNIMEGITWEWDNGANNRSKNQFRVSGIKMIEEEVNTDTKIK